MNDNFFQVDDRQIGIQHQVEEKSGFAEAVEAVWRGFQRHRLAAIAILIATTISALIITLMMTPEYTAATRIEINREEENITNVEGLEAAESNQDLEFYQTQYSLLESRSVAERVASSLSVISDDALFELHDDDINQALSDFRAGGGEKLTDARFRLKRATDILLEHVAVEPLRGSRLADVTYTSPNASFSARVANLWVEEYQADTLDRSFVSTADAREYLEARLDELRKRLEESERQLVGYAAANEIIPLASDQDSDGNTDTVQTLRSSDLQALNAALAQATAERINAESRARQKGNASAESLNNQALNLLRDRRAQVASELAKLEAIFEPEYPQVQALQSQLDELDANIAREESRVRSAAATNFNGALAREQALKERVAVLKSATLDERRNSIQYAIYQREVDTNRELYEALLQRYKEIGVAGVQTSNISVVDAARVPDKPSSPSLPLNLLLGFLGGIAFSGAYIFAREQLNQSLRDPAVVLDMLGLPLLGAIPAKGDAKEIADELDDPKSEVSEAYLAATSNLSFLTKDGAPSSFLITSSRPSEGKSTTAHALAVSLSRVGKSVLIIDADLRKPSQHNLFGLDNSRGLSHILSGSVDRDQINSLILKSRRERLDLLPSGPIPPDPGVLLSNGKLESFIGGFKANYDHVIIDAPPVMGLADSLLLSKSVEGVIYAIESNGAIMRVIKASLKRLHLTGTRIFGVIVTKVDMQASGGYGYAEMYGYGYGSDHDDR